jgi:DNA-binding transcriptional regulator YhcF (GntR family)
MKIYQWRSNLLEYELTPSTKLIAFIISEYYRENKKCYPSIRTLTENSGFGSSNTILKAIKELQENNLIKVEKYLKKGMARPTNSYIFLGVVSPSETSNDTSLETSDEASLDTSPSETEITETTEVTKSIKKEKKISLLSDEELKDKKDLWIEWLNHKKKVFKKKYKTERGERTQFNNFVKYGGDRAYLDKVMDKEWEGFYEIKEFKDGKQQQRKEY